MSEKQKAKRLTEWEVHVQCCAKCKSVDISKTATLASACNSGAPMLREELARTASKTRPRVRVVAAPDLIDGVPIERQKAPQYVVRERYTTTEIDPKTKEPVEVEKEKTISPVYLRSDTANEFLQLARKTGGGDQSRFFVTQR